MVFLNSSAVLRAEYDASSMELQLWFPGSGGPYIYYDVPQSVFEGLIGASSAGTYFNRFIRDQYGRR